MRMIADFEFADHFIDEINNQRLRKLHMIRYKLIRIQSCKRIQKVFRNYLILGLGSFNFAFISMPLLMISSKQEHVVSLYNYMKK